MDKGKPADWMKQLYERILKHPDRERWATLSIMARTRGFEASEGHLRKQYLMLQYTGFIAPITSEMYELTTDGVQYLRGQIDTRHRPEPIADRVLRS